LTDFLFMRKLELLRITIQCRSADILSALQLELYTQNIKLPATKLLM